jgi:hypothetical protein
MEVGAAVLIVGAGLNTKVGAPVSVGDIVGTRFKTGADAFVAWLGLTTTAATTQTTTNRHQQSVTRGKPEKIVATSLSLKEGIGLQQR